MAFGGSAPATASSPAPEFDWQIAIGESKQADGFTIDSGAFLADPANSQYLAAAYQAADPGAHNLAMDKPN